MSAQQFTNPLFKGFMPPARHTGACASIPPSLSESDLPEAPLVNGRFLRSTPRHLHPLALEALERGEIINPRMAPHSRGMQPRKSCMKRSSSQTSPCGRSVRFMAPADRPVTCQCIITGQQFFPIGGKARRKEIPNLPVDARYEWAESPCDLDESMSGVDPDPFVDAEAMQLHEYEMELDEQHKLAARNAAENKCVTAPGLPYWFIPHKTMNYLHPCVQDKPRKVRRPAQPEPVFARKPF